MRQLHIRDIEVPEFTERILDGTRLSYDEFKQTVLLGRSAEYISDIAVICSLNFDPRFSTARGFHVNGPAETVVHVDGCDYRVTSNFAKLM